MSEEVGTGDTNLRFITKVIMFEDMDLDTINWSVSVGKTLSYLLTPVVSGPKYFTTSVPLSI